MVVLVDGITLRAAQETDAEGLALAFRRDREHLAPWEPRRPESYFTEVGQAARLQDQLRQQKEGLTAPWLLDDDGAVVGAVTLTGITRGAFLSAWMGYWVAASHQGRGLVTAAVTQVCRLAREELGLHRLEASTLPENERSQRVLERCGFERIGFAPRYLHINGQWRDHLLFQRTLHDGPPTL
ncbi:alanine acetyltransferase [Streptacidiphilus pinicola]|uniref:Alanine acetyltransferase n=1 Tax=Streptacidiphilus pinicola TaxID=2219663 RepID=A0A2X0I9D3_9ACTN|nr:GNAT family N-acetyltransferase [Streptacidiphilus pinicola]RAG81534.1 alanine acetyltransferase [Streptacidiphilus pinicola]